MPLIIPGQTLRGGLERQVKPTSPDHLFFMADELLQGSFLAAAAFLDGTKTLSSRTATGATASSPSATLPHSANGHFESFVREFSRISLAGPVCSLRTWNDNVYIASRLLMYMDGHARRNAGPEGILQRSPGITQQALPKRFVAHGLVDDRLIKLPIVLRHILSFPRLAPFNL
jgi:hypothetical protein